jgi:hypothetical protein
MWKKVTAAKSNKTFVPPFLNTTQHDYKTEFTGFIPADSSIPLVTGDFVRYDYGTSSSDDAWYIWKILCMYRDKSEKQIYAVLQWHRPGHSKRLASCAEKVSLRLSEGMLCFVCAFILCFRFLSNEPHACYVLQ